jgi:hypothetical protein
MAGRLGNGDILGPDLQSLDCVRNDILFLVRSRKASRNVRELNTERAISGFFSASAK